MASPWGDLNPVHACSPSPCQHLTASTIRAGYPSSSDPDHLPKIHRLPTPAGTTSSSVTAPENSDWLIGPESAASNLRDPKTNVCATAQGARGTTATGGAARMVECPERLGSWMDTSYGTSGAAVCTAAASNGRLQEVYVRYYCSLHRRDSVDKEKENATCLPHYSGFKNRSVAWFSDWHLTNRIQVSVTRVYSYWKLTSCFTAQFCTSSPLVSVSTENGKL